MTARQVSILGAGANWMDLCGRISLGLAGYASDLPEGSSVAVVNMHPGIAALDGPLLVAEGRFDIGVTTPSWFAQLAYEGRPPFTKPLALRALADFPHDDRMIFAVRRDLGIGSLAEVAARKIPLRISMPSSQTRHPVVWAVESVLAAYGMSLAAIESWGGRILDDRPSDMGNPRGEIVSPEFDAVFDEAIMSPRWRLLAEQYDLVFLSLEPEILARLEQSGWRRGVISTGRFRGISRDVFTADFSGWLLFCGADCDDELAFLTVAAIAAQKAAIERVFNGRASLSGPVDLFRAAQAPIPLHPGAERFYRENGYMAG